MPVRGRPTMKIGRLVDTSRISGCFVTSACMPSRSRANGRCLANADSPEEVELAFFFVRTKQGAEIGQEPFAAEVLELRGATCRGEHEPSERSGLPPGTREMAGPSTFTVLAHQGSLNCASERPLSTGDEETTGVLLSRLTRADTPRDRRATRRSS